MSDRLLELEIFTRTVALGSLSAAARAMGISTTAASRRLAALEERLGHRLVERTTRQLRLTDAGRLLFAEGGHLLDRLDALEATLQAPPPALAALRLSADRAAASALLAPALLPFLQAHPDLSLELTLTDTFAADPPPDGQVSLVVGPLRDDPAVARALCPWPFALCSAPGGPAGIIHYTGAPPLPSGGGPPRLEINSASTAREAALAGLGAALLPEILVAADLEAGRLVRLEAAGLALPETWLLVLCTPRTLLAAEVQALLGLLASALPRAQGLQ